MFPTKVSQLENDSEFITVEDIPDVDYNDLINLPDASTMGGVINLGAQPIKEKIQDFRYVLIQVFILLQLQAYHI